MTIVLIVVGLLVLILIGIAISAAMSDPKDIENEEAAAADRETPEERREFLRRSSKIPDPLREEYGKGEPGGEDASSI